MKIEDFPGLDAITLGKYIGEDLEEYSNQQDQDKGENLKDRKPKIFNFDHNSTFKFVFVPSMLDILSCIHDLLTGVILITHLREVCLVHLMII